MLNQNKHTKTKPKPTLIFKNCSYVCVCVSRLWFWFLAWSNRRITNWFCICIVLCTIRYDTMEYINVHLKADE